MGIEETLEGRARLAVRAEDAGRFALVALEGALDHAIGLLVSIVSGAQETGPRLRLKAYAG